MGGWYVARPMEKLYWWSVGARAAGGRGGRPDNQAPAAIHG
jgi:hypothetical protein